MKRATMTLPDDLAKAVDRYLASQEAPPSLTTMVQAALTYDHHFDVMRIAVWR
jgi:hypothetical protein